MIEAQMLGHHAVLRLNHIANRNCKRARTKFKHAIRPRGRLLHWTSVALLVALIVSANSFNSLDGGAELNELMQLHLSYGLVFFLIISLRVYWRLTNKNPVYSYRLRSWQKTAAVSLHRAICVVLVSQCAVGICNAAYSGEPFALFGVIEWPSLTGASTDSLRTSKAIHYAISLVIYPLFAIHIIAANYHQLIGVRDD